MKYVVELNGERHEVELDGGAVRTGDRTLEARFAELDGTPVRLVTIGDRVHRVVQRKLRGRGSYVLWIDGYRFEAEALDERTRSIRDVTAATRSSGPAPLVAPMPGLILRVNVAPGDTVSAGQGLVVMEAMKMENELRAAGAGRVRTVLCAQGSAVEKGMVLIELDALELGS